MEDVARRIGPGLGATMHNPAGGHDHVARLEQVAVDGAGVFDVAGKVEGDVVAESFGVEGVEEGVWMGELRIGMLI